MSELVTIVIPHYRAEVLFECLEALFAHSDLPIRVIVVDDGPDAPSILRARQEFPQILVLRNDRNRGFCAACNRGLAEARTRFAVLLNDDTRVTPNWLTPMVEAARADPAIAACQPKLLSATDPDVFDYGGAAGGYIDRLGYTFCRGRLFECRERDEGQYDAPARLFWACGSALFLRLEAVQRVGLLDPDYVAHFEEIDLCWRLRLGGYRIAAVPASVVYHHSGFSLPPSTYRKSYLNHRNNLVALYKNMPLSELVWVLPVRFFLEIAASLGYALKREWRSAPAPVVALLWCVSHPLNLSRRRRQSQTLRPRRAAPLLEGVYQGSILYQYFARGVRRAACLMREEAGS